MFLIVFLVLMACTEENERVVTHDSEEVQEVQVTANHVSTIEVEGMVCQMGCGGSIRKALKNTGAVSKVEFDFEEDRPTDIATVYFDNEKVSQEELVKIIAGLNDGQFTVGNVNTESTSEEKTHEDHHHSSDEAHEVEMTSSNFQIPNLLDLFSGLLPG